MEKRSDKQTLRQTDSVEVKEEEDEGRRRKEHVSKRMLEAACVASIMDRLSHVLRCKM